MRLGVNIDHVATIRNARGVSYPSPLEAALTAETHGADSITLHLREDRRHIRDDDVWQIRSALRTKMNLEMALTDEMLDFALQVKPHDVCIVPEQREELTTEGGLDVAGFFEKTRDFVQRLKEEDIRVSLFIDPNIDQIEAAKETAADFVELHTGAYANAATDEERRVELERIEESCYDSVELGLGVNAGHGLNYHNVAPIAAISPIRELNIGHAIIAQALMVGLPRAVRDMKDLIYRAQSLPEG